MKTDAQLIKFGEWTLRIRPGTGKRILLLLHGWTGDENSMTIFSNNFPSDYWILFPRAPYPAKPQGFSWRAPAPESTLPTIDLFRPSIEALIDLIKEFALAHNLISSEVDVCGFSQGGAMTFTFGALYPARVNKMGILAGFAPDGSEKILSPILLSGKKIFLAHGTKDDMVPISLARKTMDLLKNSGAQVSYCESEIGHKLSSDCLKALENFLAE